MDLELQNRPVALITGASRGIGAATARELARRGYALALAARSADALKALADELSAAGCPTLPITVDLQDPDELRRLAHRVLGHFGRVDVLVNNAGVGKSEVVARITSDEIERTLTTNLIAPITLTRALLPGMIARRSGAIIFVASVAGHIGLPLSALYGASKFGLRGFALSLRRELLRRGVGVTLVSPGFIDTAMTAELRGVPKASAEQVARVIADAVTRPRREIIIPGYYRLFVWFDRMLPGLMDLVLGLRLK